MAKASTLRSCSFFFPSGDSSAAVTSLFRLAIKRLMLMNLPLKN